jgi:hypothetical protein
MGIPRRSRSAPGASAASANLRAHKPRCARHASWPSTSTPMQSPLPQTGQSGSLVASSSAMGPFTTHDPPRTAQTRQGGSMGDGKDGKTEVSTTLAVKDASRGVSDRTKRSASAACLIAAAASLADLPGPFPSRRVGGHLVPGPTGAPRQRRVGRHPGEGQGELALAREHQIEIWCSELLSLLCSVNDAVNVLPWVYLRLP